MHILIYFFHIFNLLLRSQENSISSHQKLQLQFTSFLLHFQSQKSQLYTNYIFNITKFK